MSFKVFFIILFSFVFVCKSFEIILYFRVLIMCFRYSLLVVLKSFIMFDSFSEGNRFKYKKVINILKVCIFIFGNGIYK